MVLELIIGVLILIILILVWRLKVIQKRFEEMLFDKRSLSVKYGKTTEQFFPFMKDFPYEAGNFRFLGTPIDGVSFEKDKIIFLEFKSGDSTLSKKQKEIKDLVRKGKVKWEEMRIR